MLITVVWFYKMAWLKYLKPWRHYCWTIRNDKEMFSITDANIVLVLKMINTFRWNWWITHSCYYFGISIRGIKIKGFFQAPFYPIAPMVRDLGIVFFFFYELFAKNKLPIMCRSHIHTHLQWNCKISIYFYFFLIALAMTVVEVNL